MGKSSKKKLNKRIMYVGIKVGNKPIEVKFYDRKTGNEIIFKGVKTFIETKIKKLV